MLLLPCVRLVARPEPSITTTLRFELLQVTALDTSDGDPSELVAVAVNCWVLPTGMEAAGGEIAIETTTGTVTVSVAP